jgi:uncharacterized protein
MNAGVAPSVEGFSSDRIAVVDVLRAFALFGIIIAHSQMGFLAGPPPDPLHMTFSSLDKVVGELARLFTFGKFFAIFSFLFGLSFAIQLANATRKGTPFAGRFIWRLMILLAIGFAHHVFFSGDILMIYALLGLLLVPCRRFNNRTLLIAALILILNIPGLVLGTLQVTAPPPTPAQQQAAAESRKQFMEGAQRQYTIKQSGTLEELIDINVKEALVTKVTFQLFTGRFWITFGLFLLGLYAGRLNLFRDTEANRHIFKRLLIGSGVVALITTVIAAAFPTSFRVASLRDVLGTFSFSIQQASVAAFFVAAITLSYWKNPSRGLLPHLAPMGKMGLTTYLMQSVFGLIAFYGIGFGLLGKLGIAASVALGILFFVAQIFIARWWMAHFTLGPVEWLWRSLTYFKLQPNGRGQVSAA